MEGKKQKQVIDLSGAEPLTLLTNDIVRDISKYLRPADLARLGMVDRRLRDISTQQIAEILADPRLTKLAQTYRSRLMRPLIHFAHAQPGSLAHPHQKGTETHLLRPQYMQRDHQVGIFIKWPDLDNAGNRIRSYADLNDDEYDLARKRNYYGNAWIRDQLGREVMRQ